MSDELASAADPISIKKRFNRVEHRLKKLNSRYKTAVWVGGVATAVATALGISAAVLFKRVTDLTGQATDLQGKIQKIQQDSAGLRDELRDISSRETRLQDQIPNHETRMKLLTQIGQGELAQSVRDGEDEIKKAKTSLETEVMKLSTDVANRVANEVVDSRMKRVESDINLLYGNLNFTFPEHWDQLEWVKATNEKMRQINARAKVRGTLPNSTTQP